MNRINITGRLVRDPELRSTTEGTPVCTIRIAVDRMKRGNETGFIDITEYGPAAEATARTISQGWLVAVDGRLETHEWTAKDGGTRHAYQIVGHVEFLAAPRAQQPDANGTQPVAAGNQDDDIEF